MRRAPRVVVVAPRIGPGLDRGEAILAVRIGHATARTIEVRIHWRWVLITFMNIAARGIGLPKFKQRVRNRPAVFIKYAPFYDNALPKRLAVGGAIPGQVVVERADIRMPVNRYGELGKGLPG